MRVLPLVFLLAAFSAAAQDYEREKRWAAEVEASRVVGILRAALADLGYSTLSLPG